jgi:hypothetical protein
MPARVKVVNENVGFDRFDLQPQLENLNFLRGSLKIWNERSWFHYYSLA